MTHTYLKIDSSQRQGFSTSTPSQFALHSYNHEFKGRYVLKYTFIPVTFYTVTSLNCMVYFTDTVSHAVQIPYGFYDSSTILTAVANTMTSASTAGTYTITKNPVTRNITISLSSGMFVLNFSQLAASIAPLLGFAAKDTIAASNQTAPLICNVVQTKSFNISINGLSSVMDLSGRAGYSFIVPLTVNQLSIQVYEPEAFVQEVVFETPTRDLNIAIYDDQQNIISLQDDFYFIIQKVSD